MPLGRNQHQTISYDKHCKIYQLGQKKPRISHREIARMVDCVHTAVMKYRDIKPVKPVEIAAPDLHDAIRKVLKKEALSGASLADALDVSPKRIAAAIKEMTAKGSMIHVNLAGEYEVKPAFAAESGKAEVVAAKSGHGNGEWSHVFGVTSDNHLCNRHSRLDVLNAAYDEFERQGITTVYNAGNWIDGSARFNQTELIVRPGMDSQLDYMIDKWPVKKDITTFYIAGDDHEGWFQQREGIEVGRYLQHRSEDAGRQDLKYLGYAEADITLKHGTGEAIMRVVHPGGGSAYAISYTDQQRVNSYQAGNKPNVELAGHYHKYNHTYVRDVNAVQVGTTCEQSLFMRKKRLAAHLGFVVIRIKQDAKGAVSRFQTEWFPFYDLAYYGNKRF